MGFAHVLVWFCFMCLSFFGSSLIDEVVHLLLVSLIGLVLFIAMELVFCHFLFGICRVKLVVPFCLLFR